jgi:thiol-disulfide isomerase/thioredoxin
MILFSKLKSKGVKGVVIIVFLLLIAGGWFFIKDEKVELGEVGATSDAEDFLAVEGEGGDVGQMMPDVVLKDYDGNEMKLSSYIGKPLVINSWAVWCPFCVKELSDFVLVQKEFTDEVVIIAVNRGESLAEARELSDEPGVVNELNFLLDLDDSFYRAIGGFAMPETIFVDADGRVRFHKRGPMDEEEIRQRVQQLVSL